MKAIAFCPYSEIAMEVRAVVILSPDDRRRSISLSVGLEETWPAYLISLSVSPDMAETITTTLWP